MTKSFTRLAIFTVLASAFMGAANAGEPTVSLNAAPSDEAAVLINNDHYGNDDEAVLINNDHRSTDENAVLINNNHYGTDENAVLINNDHYGTGDMVSRDSDYDS